MKPITRLTGSILLGIGFFALPISNNGISTILFDIIVTNLRKGVPDSVNLYCLGLVLWGATATLLSFQKEQFHQYKCSLPLAISRTTGALIAIFMSFKIGPEWFINARVSGLIWEILVQSVAIIVPIGAIFLNIFISYGFLEFVGTLMKPIMKPLFRLPGRSALDDLTSWLGSYSVGLYITHKLMVQGYYNRRETFIIVTCFSTVSIGFVGVVASTLDILPLFPLLFATYFFTIYFLAAVLIRMWPISKVPQTYVGEPSPEEETRGSIISLTKTGLRTALDKASNAQSYLFTIKEGFFEGIKLASTILGSILTLGTLAILLVEYTPLFNILGKPLVAVLSIFGFADAAILAPATLAGITEMYVPALMVKSASIPGKFFIASLSISQLIFFSSVGPMIMDMFKEIPIRFFDLVILFFLRTAILIPTLALLVNLYGYLGWL